MSGNHGNAKRRKLDDPYHPDLETKDFREAHGAALKQLHKYQDKLNLLCGTSSISICVSEFVQQTIYVAPKGLNRPIIDETAQYSIIKSLEDTLKYFKYSKKDKENCALIRRKEIRELFVKFGNGEEFTGKYFELNHITTQILKKFEKSPLFIKEVAQTINQKSEIGISFKESPIVDQRNMALYIAISSLIINFNDLGLNKGLIKSIIPVQSQMRAVYKLGLGERGLILDFGKSYIKHFSISLF